MTDSNIQRGKQLIAEIGKLQPQLKAMEEELEAIKKSLPKIYHFVPAKDGYPPFAGTMEQVYHYVENELGLTHDDDEFKVNRKHLVKSMQVFEHGIMAGDKNTGHIEYVTPLDDNYEEIRYLANYPPF